MAILKELVHQCPVTVRNSVLYYNLTELQTFISKISEDITVMEDAIITPFYICSKGILEIYDYELNIRLVEFKQYERYLLSRTGASQMKEIDELIEDKLRRCYVEIVKPDTVLSIKRLDNYFDYVKSSMDIKQRVDGAIEKFDVNKLYLVYY